MSKIVKAVVGIAAIAASFIPGVGPIAGAVLRAVGAGLASSALAPKPQLPEVSSATGGRLNKSLEPEAYRKMVYGRTAMATDTRYWEVFGADQSDVHEVIALATHKITSVDEIYVDDELVEFDGSGNATGRYAGALSRQIVLVGTTGTAVSVGAGSKWNASGGEAASMTGLAYLVLKWKWTQEKLPNGIPVRITVVGKGAAVYDPRRDSTRGGSGSHRVDDPSTWAYSTLDSNSVPIGRNRALQTLHYLIGERIENPSTEELVLVAGMGLDPDDIDFASFIQAANDCETEEYYGDGILTTGDSHATNIAVLEAACAGRVSDRGGRYSMRIMVDDFGSGAVEFTDSDLVGESEWRPDLPIAAQGYNQIAGQFVDPDALYQIRPLPLVRDTVYEAADEVRERTSVTLDHVQDGDQAQKLLRIQLNKTRRAGMFEGPFGWRAVNVQVGDAVKLTSSRHGFSERWFRVRAQKVDPGGAVWMALEDDAPEVYTGGTVLPVPAAGAGAGYDPQATVEPSGDDWTLVGGVVGAVDGPRQPGIAVTGGTLPDGITGVWVEYRRGTSGAWTKWYKGEPRGDVYTIFGLVAGANDYYVSIRYRNAFGVWTADADRLISGPLTVGESVAGDALDVSSIRDAVDSAAANAAAAFQNMAGAFGFTGDEVVDAVDGSLRILAQSGSENLIRDPRNFFGSAQWVSDQGVTQWAEAARRGGKVEYTASAAAEAVELQIWQGEDGNRGEQTFSVLPGARIMASAELAVTGATNTPLIRVVFLDAAGDATGSPVDLATDVGGGRTGGFIAPASVPAGARQFRIRPRTTSSGAGALTLSVLDPFVSFAGPNLDAVPAFVEPKDEQIIRARETAIITEREGVLSFILSSRTARAQSTAGLALSVGETNASAILGVQTSLTSLSGTVTTQGSAITSLDTRVTTAEGAITTNSSAITTVQSSLATAEGNITTNAGAISSLDTRVTTAEGTISSTSSAVTSLTSRVDDNEVGVDLFLSAYTDGAGNALAVVGFTLDVNGRLAGARAFNTGVTSGIDFAFDEVSFGGVQIFTALGGGLLTAPNIVVENLAADTVVTGTIAANAVSFGAFSGPNALSPTFVDLAPSGTSITQLDPVLEIPSAQNEEETVKVDFCFNYSVLWQGTGSQSAIAFFDMVRRVNEGSWTVVQSRGAGSVDDVTTSFQGGPRTVTFFDATPPAGKLEYAIRRRNDSTSSANIRFVMTDLLATAIQLKR